MCILKQWQDHTLRQRAYGTEISRGKQISVWIFALEVPRRLVLVLGSQLEESDAWGKALARGCYFTFYQPGLMVSARNKNHLSLHSETGYNSTGSSPHLIFYHRFALSLPFTSSPLFFVHVCMKADEYLLYPGWQIRVGSSVETKPQNNFWLLPHLLCHIPAPKSCSHHWLCANNLDF